jgi:hypothetical protein
VAYIAALITIYPPCPLRASVSCATDECRTLEAPMATEYPSTHYCGICGGKIVLEKCSTDEHGSAVHEACYVARIKMETESSSPGSNRVFENET